MYESLTAFEKQLAAFGDKVQIIVGLEIGGKIPADKAYKEIKTLLKDLKKLRKTEIKFGHNLDDHESELP